MGTIVVGGAVVVVCVGGYYRYLRSPSDEGLQPKDEEVTEWQLDLPGIETTLQMARLALIVYEDDCVDALGGAGQAKGKLKGDDAYQARLRKEGGEGTEMWFYECAAEGTEAAVTFSPKNKRCTVIFRGTEFELTRAGFLDVKADIIGTKKPLGPDGDDDHPGCLVHRGFRAQYYGEVTAHHDGDVSAELSALPGSMQNKVLETVLMEKVEAVLKRYPETKLYVTGHSLGAALSVLFGIRLALKLPNQVQVINFGCPKVGNAAFAKLVNTKDNLCVQRVAHKRDIITRVPNLGYNHVGHTIQIDEASDVKPCAFKWHTSRHAMTNWNPMMGSGSDHRMAGYLKALNSHGTKKPWVTKYNGSS